MRILLTGNKGLVGNKVEHALLLKGIDIEKLDCNFDFSRFEVAFTSLKHCAGKFDLIIHCGAISNSEAQGNALWELNYKASCEITDYCRFTDTKLLFISSAAAIAPTTSYGWSKHCAEYYMQQRVPDMNLCIFRPYNIWCFDEDKENPSIIYKIINRQLKQIYAECRRDFIHVSDVVSAIQQATLNWTPGTFDIGTATAVSISALVDKLYQGTTLKKPPIVDNNTITKYLVANPELLLPNWKPTPIYEHLEALCERVKTYET